MRDFPFENPMNRGAKIAGWIYFPIHVVVLPLFLGTVLYLIAGTVPSDITCNIWYYAIGLAFTLVAMWKFLRQSYENMLNRFAYSFAMILAAYAVDLLLSIVLQLFMTFLGELPVPNNDTIMDLAGQNYRRMFAVAVFMAPLVEECLFRGVVFGTIRQKRSEAGFSPILSPCCCSRSTTCGSTHWYMPTRSICSPHCSMSPSPSRWPTAMTARSPSGRRCFSTCSSMPCPCP